MLKKRVAVLISGNGTNLQALLDAAAETDYPAEISLVISNVADAYGLTRAQQHDIPTIVLPDTDFTSREGYDQALQNVLQEHDIDYVCLAGFMRLLSAGFVERWHGKMLNIHPSLLPSFKGLHTQRQAIEAGVRFTGCTVHFVVPEVDSGPIVIQAVTPVAQDDTEESLQQRIHEAEHHIYPEALRLLAANKLKIDGQRVITEGSSPHSKDFYTS
jgi:phosphoribosylglycinamide formyltransferase-1